MCARFFHSPPRSLDNEGAQRVSVARGYPFVQDAPAPFRPFAPPCSRPLPRASVHRIKPPCRRVHLAFYGLICLAAAVTTSRKTTSSIFVRGISAVRSAILSRHQPSDLVRSALASFATSLAFFFLSFFVVSVSPFVFFKW